MLEYMARVIDQSGAAANVSRALRASEEVLLELVPLFAVNSPSKYFSAARNSMAAKCSMLTAFVWRSLRGSQKTVPPDAIPSPSLRNPEGTNAALVDSVERGPIVS